MTWQRSVLSNIFGDLDAKVILIENGHEVVHVRDNDRDDRRRGVGWYLVIDQLGGLDLEGVDTAILQNLGIFAIEWYVGRHQFADGYITVARHLEIKMARVFVLQC